ncbi:TetR/AcrR family transcriptional regulator [Streptomyces iconiensis]|uniref:TetR/AcrR family transcriptional regulator n=1 Tax=Streptomyces iconiensis TaxID=1384038 RepID=A0ABT7A3K0_9ACTN|nr:TetR/AcrR family transcriptional regulator [Streptomyces iconiensis]MDJ1135907.1 TetR/AcrR family transcriptional regulator [Streptomyces iconiensis]
MPHHNPDTPRAPRRADAERSRTAILTAATRVLGAQHDAGLDDIAKAAGVSRQTVYAHFTSRETLINAVFDHVTEGVVAAMDAAMNETVDGEPAETTLIRLLSASSHVADQLPIVLRDQPLTSERAHELHRPIVERFAEVIERGQRSGEFSDRLSCHWLVAAIIALVHTAADEVDSGRMTANDAEAALRISLRKLTLPTQ